MDTSQIDEQVEKILTTTTVSKAQEVMGSTSGLWLISVISIIESATPLPILTDPFMVAAVMLNRAKFIKIILITTVSSVIGGIIAYFTALFFLDLALQWLSPEAAFSLAAMTATEQQNIFILTIVGAFTPVPYTLTAWAVGVMKGSLPVFIIASIIGRSARYLIVGWLAYQFGPAAVKYAKRSIGITSILLLIGVAAYFYLKM